MGNDSRFDPNGGAKKHYQIIMDPPNFYFATKRSIIITNPKRKEGNHYSKT